MTTIDAGGVLVHINEIALGEINEIALGEINEIALDFIVRFEAKTA